MPLKKGDKAPEFTLVDTEKKPHTLGEFLGKKTVLAFYPGAYTGVCTKEMCALRDSLGALGTMNAHVVGISVDSPFSNKAFARENNLTFPLLSDYTEEVSKTYVGLYDNFSGLKGYTAAKRSVVILDEKGIVRDLWILESPADEPPYDEIKKSLASF